MKQHRRKLYSIIHYNYSNSHHYFNRNLDKVQMNDATMPVTHKMMPRFIYPDGHVWDPLNPLVDAFKGHFLIHVSARNFSLIGPK